MNFVLPENVSKIIELLNNAGFEAYAVGGCVRDTLLGTEPKDWDITTSAEPLEVKAIFHRTVDTGIKHGTVTVLFGGGSYEITTYRLDGKYEDARHPSDVTFTKSLKEDLLRRDFTINAMAYNDKDGLVDIFGGREDLEKKIIRCVGNPYERFNEDALRILRAYRFSARLGFEIEDETRAAAGEIAHKLSLVSAERIRDELSKLLVSGRPEKFKSLYEDGILKVIFPELSPFFDDEGRAEEILAQIRQMSANTEIPEHDVLALAWGTVAIGTCTDKKPEERKDFAAALMRKLKFDNDSIRLASGLAFYCDFKPQNTEEAARRTINQMGDRLFDMLMLYLKSGHQAGTDKQYSEALHDFEILALTVRGRGDCIFLKQLAINGSDLCAKGFEKGPRMGECLNYLLDHVLADQSINTEEQLFRLAGEYYKS